MKLCIACFCVFVCVCTCVCNFFCVLCSAQKSRLLSEEEDPRDPNNVLYVGYCSNHYGRQVRLILLSTDLLEVFIACTLL